MGECKTQIRPLSSENEIELIAQISSAGVNEFKHFSIRLSFFSHKERIKLEEIIGIWHFISSQDSSPTPHPSNCCNLATLHCHLSLISRQGAERPAKQKWDVIIENDFLCRRIPGISVPPPIHLPIPSSFHPPDYLNDRFRLYRLFKRQVMTLTLATSSGGIVSPVA